MIEIKDFSFKYNDAVHPNLRNINLKIEKGEFLLITGPSGSGKTTLIRSFNGLIPHFYGGHITGQVKVQDQDVFNTPTRIMAEKVGMIFQNPENQLFMNDVENEIAFGMENLHFPRNKMKKRVEEMLNSFGLSELRKKQISTLSGGEKQKVAIASIIAMNPEVLILDEPTAELDPKSAEEILDFVLKLNSELRITIILIEHRLDRVLQFVDRVLLMKDGMIIKDGTPEQCFYENVDLEEMGISLPPLIKVCKKINSLSDGKRKKITSFNVEKCRDEIGDFLEEIEPKKNTTKSIGLDFNDYIKKFSNNKISVEFKAVSFGYNKEKLILDQINFQIHEGEFVSIIGRNGVGKTTLLKHINGLLKPKKGKVLVYGSETTKRTIAQLSSNVGYIFQNPSIQFYQDSLEEELFFVLNNYNYEKDEISKISNEVLNQFGLIDYKKVYSRYLSIGQQQKAALATVLALKPKILVLDEPTHGMDYIQKRYFMNFLNEYKKEGNSIILVTHDVETIAEYSDRVLLLSDGKIAMDDIKQNVLSKSLLFSPQINRLIKSFKNIPQNILTANELLEVIEFEEK